MAVKRYNPTSAGQRFITTIDTKDLTKKKPEKALVEVKKKHSGRNNNGHITVRHKGGGTRRQYRIIDFKRQKDAARPASRSSTTATVRSATSSRPSGSRSARSSNRVKRPTSRPATACRSRTSRSAP